MDTSLKLQFERPTTNIQHPTPNEKNSPLGSWASLKTDHASGVNASVWKSCCSVGRPGQNTSGQAMIEIIVGLVAMVVLISGLIQIVSFTRARTDVMIEAREMAGEMAFQDMPISAFAGYIQDVGVGADGRTYSSDDTTTDADAGAFDTDIVGQLVSQSDEWDTLDDLPTSPFSSLHASDVPFTEFGLLRGSASTSVLTDPAVRHLLYDANEIEIACDVWTTWTRGIY